MWQCLVIPTSAERNPCKVTNNSYGQTCHWLWNYCPLTDSVIRHKQNQLGARTSIFFWQYYVNNATHFLDILLMSNVFTHDIKLNTAKQVLLWRNCVLIISRTSWSSLINSSSFIPCWYLELCDNYKVTDDYTIVLVAKSVMLF